MSVSLNNLSPRQSVKSILTFAIFFLTVSACATSQQQSDVENNQYEQNNLNDANYGEEGQVNNNSQQYNNSEATNNTGNAYGGSNYGEVNGEDINNFNDYGESENLLAGNGVNDAGLVENNANQEPTILDEGNTLAAESPQELPANSPAVVGEIDQRPISSVGENYEDGELKPEEQLVTSGDLVQSPSVAITDVMPLNSELWWVGYDYNRRLRLLKVQMLSKGVPSFDFLQERNQNGQPELVVRFYGTGLRRKIRRDIDASEFSSPVAYVRMREDPETNVVDVVLTLREEVRPLMFARNGNVQLTFPLTSKYLGARVKTDVVSYDAESLQAAQVLPEIVVGSDLPKSSQLTKAYVPDPAGKVFDDGANTGSRNVLPMPVDAVDKKVDGEGLPVESFESDPAKAAGTEVIEETEEADKEGNDTDEFILPSAPLDNSQYDNSPDLLNDEDLESGDGDPEGLDEAYHVTEFSWLGVAQDDFSLNSNLSGGAQVLEAEDADNSGKDGGSDNGGNLNFNDVQGTDGSVDKNSALDLTSDPFAADSAAKTGTGTTSETLTMDDLGSATAVNEIVGSESEIIEEGFTGKPVMLEFYEAPLGQVLKAFADQIGTNFIYPPGLAAEKVTIKLKDVPWDAALNALLETYGLGMARVADNIVRIDQLVNMTKYIRDREEAKNIKLLSQPSKILVIRLSHAEAGKIAPKIKSDFIPDTVRASVKISSDDTTNTMFVEAPPAILARIKSLVERLDVPVPQVEIMSRIVEVARTAANFLGVSWAGAFNYDANRGLGFGTLNLPNSFGSTYSVDPGVNSAGSVGSSTFNIGSINNIIDLNLRLKMEEAKGTAEVLQSSRVMVKDRQQASINAGTKAYIRTLGTITQGQVVNQQGGPGGGDLNGSGAVTEININLSLNVTPTVANDGSVEMQLSLVSASPAASGLPGATVTTNSRSLQTRLRKKSGETAVIGGIYDTKKVEQESGIPFFSSLPIIGALFRSRTVTSSQTEMMMLITPRIQTDVEDAIAAGESAPETYQGGNNIPINNGNGSNYNNAGAAGGNYGNNYGANNSNTASNNYGNSNNGNNYNVNTANAGANNYGGNNYNNSGNNGINSGNGNYQNGGKLEGNVNDSNAEYSNNYGNY